jgi:predicted nucleic acid-binding protein
MILVDTSVWIDHFRRSNPRLQALLDQGEVLMHPAVLGELACGTMRSRSHTLSYLRDLPQVASIADAEETMFVVESRKLWEKGVGWSDVQLVASALISGCALWTHDQRLHSAVIALRIAY